MFASRIPILKGSSLKKTNIARDFAITTLPITPTTLKVLLFKQVASLPLDDIKYTLQNLENEVFETDYYMALLCKAAIANRAVELLSIRPTLYRTEDEKQCILLHRLAVNLVRIQKLSQQLSQQKSKQELQEATHCIIGTMQHLIRYGLDIHQPDNKNNTPYSILKKANLTHHIQDLIETKIEKPKLTSYCAMHR